MYNKLLLYNNVEEYKLDENTGREGDKGGEFVLLSVLFAKQLVKGKVTYVQVPQWGKGKKRGTWKKNGASEASLPVDWGRGKGGRAWRHAFDAADPPSSNELVTEMSSRQVLTTDTSVSLLCRLC